MHIRIVGYEFLAQHGERLRPIRAGAEIARRRQVPLRYQVAKNTPEKQMATTTKADSDSAFYAGMFLGPLVVVLMPLILAPFLLLRGLTVMVAWNWLLCKLFVLMPLGYVQALALSAA